MKDQLKKANDENQKFSKEVLEVNNSILKFKKEKETLDNLLDSQKSHGDTHGIGYKNGMTPCRRRDLARAKVYYDRDTV